MRRIAMTAVLLTLGLGVAARVAAQDGGSAGEGTDAGAGDTASSTGG